MAVITPLESSVDANFSNYVTYTWSGLKVGDTAVPLKASPIGDRAVQVSGVFSAASIRLVGSLDNINYFPLTDPQGNVIDVLSGKIETIMELVIWIKPEVVGGDGSTDLKVVLCIKGRG